MVKILGFADGAVGGWKPEDNGSFCIASPAACGACSPDTGGTGEESGNPSSLSVSPKVNVGGGDMMDSGG